MKILNSHTENKLFAFSEAI